MARRFFAIASLIAALAACAPPRDEDPAKPGAAADETAYALCAAFAPDTSAADLVQRFGAEHVEDATIEGGEGQSFPGTILFPDDPTRRVEITWHDPAARQGVASAAIYEARSDWTGPGGVSVGMDLAAVQAANQSPFQLYGFGWDYGGTVADWLGGRLEGDCRLIVIFAPASPEIPAGAAGDSRFLSTDAAIRAAAPRVAMIAVGWPEEEAAAATPTE